MTKRREQEILEKYMSGPIRQNHRGIGQDDPKRIPCLSPLNIAELRTCIGFAVDDEGTVEFNWFYSEEGMLAALDNWLSQRADASDGASPAELLRQEVKAATGQEGYTRRAQARIQRRLLETYPAFPLAWVGKFESLTATTEGFAKEVRLRFWATTTEGEEYVTCIITEDLYPNFARFLDSFTDFCGG